MSVIKRNQEHRSVGGRSKADLNRVDPLYFDRDKIVYREGIVDVFRHAARLGAETEGGSLLELDVPGRDGVVGLFYPVVATGDGEKMPVSVYFDDGSSLPALEAPTSLLKDLSDALMRKVKELKSGRDWKPSGPEL